MIVFPPYSLLVLQSLIEIAGVNITETVTFGLVSEDKVFSTVFAAPEEDDSEIQENCYETGYQSNYLTINLGTMYFALLFLLFLSIMTFACKACERRSNYIKRKI